MSSPISWAIFTQSRAACTLCEAWMLCPLYPTWKGKSGISALWVMSGSGCWLLSLLSDKEDESEELSDESDEEELDDEEEPEDDELLEDELDELLLDDPDEESELLDDDLLQFSFLAMSHSSDEELSDDEEESLELDEELLEEDELSLKIINTKVISKTFHNKNSY